MSPRLWMLLAIAGAAPLAAQGVMIAPHAVFIDSRQRSGAITLYNPGRDPVEVAIAIFYGYTTTDTTGSFKLETLEQPDSTQPSAATWIQAFPRRLTVGPQERQTIRLLASPPPGLRDGEYWARIAFTVKAGQLPVSGVEDTARIKVGLSLEVRTIIGIAYRKGAVQTGIAVSNFRAAIVGDSLIARAHLVRQGNASYNGTAHGVLVNPSGRTMAEFVVPLGVFFDSYPHWAAGLSAPLAPGRYRLRLEVESTREDLSPDVVLKAVTVRDSAEVVVP